jgi:hypothetical protein
VRLRGLVPPGCEGRLAFEADCVRGAVRGEGVGAFGAEHCCVERSEGQVWEIFGMSSGCRLKFPFRKISRVS